MRYRVGEWRPKDGSRGAWLAPFPLVRGTLASLASHSPRTRLTRLALALHSPCTCSTGSPPSPSCSARHSKARAASHTAPPSRTCPPALLSACSSTRRNERYSHYTITHSHLLVHAAHGRRAAVLQLGLGVGAPVQPQPHARAVGQSARVQLRWAGKGGGSVARLRARCVHACVPLMPSRDSPTDPRYSCASRRRSIRAIGLQKSVPIVQSACAGCGHCSQSRPSLNGNCSRNLSRALRSVR